MKVICDKQLQQRSDSRYAECSDYRHDYDCGAVMYVETRALPGAAIAATCRANEFRG